MATNTRDQWITTAMPRNDGHEICETLKQLNHEHQIDFLQGNNEVVLRKIIDAGSFGIVDLVRFRKKLYAHKRAISNNYEQQFNIIKEATRLAQISGLHPNIPKIHFINLKSLGYFMEYCGCGSLDNFLRKSDSTYTLQDVLSWSYQLADALSFLHSKNLMHRDVKLANLLLKDNYQTLVLSDYGTATDLRRALLTRQAGTPITMAPEVCDTSNYSERCDIYSWAIVFWQLLTKQTTPYDEKISSYFVMVKVSVEKLRPAPLTSCPEIFRSLLYRSWHSNPLERPNLDFIKKILRLFLRQLPRTSCSYQTVTTTDNQPMISLNKYQPSEARSHIERSTNLYNEHCQKLQQIVKLKQMIRLRINNLESYRNQNDSQFDQLEELNEENQRLQNEINQLKDQHR